MEPFISQSEEYCPFCDGFYTLEKNCACYDSAKFMKDTNKSFAEYIKTPEADAFKRYIDDLAKQIGRKI
jgi:threonine dehydrogenase-like Zn-dependent dehydrogenase